MRSLKYVFAALMLLCVMPALSFAQTPTATATAPAAASTISQTFSKISHFGYLSADQANLLTFGGYVVHQKATAALLLGQVVKPDASNAGQVVVSTSGTIDPIGVVIGAGTPGAAGQASGLGVAPGTGQMAIIQCSGITIVACDRAMSPGQVVMSSTLVNGDVGPYVAGTVDEQIGVMLSACVVNGPGQMLIYK